MKYCNTCETEKSKSMFGNRKASIDGLSPKCKTCQKVYDKARLKDPQRQEARRVYAQTDEGRIKSNKAKADYRKRNPAKVSAHSKVRRAIRLGNLHRQPCEACKSTKDIEAHHDDYSKPLNVRWLCSTHHSEWHRKNRALNS